ncbi:PAN2-PAN3 deadenylation complex subunit pan3 [Varanus komodoensis]|nr:PAN2-PAN3 deadenylation complex subunit pan3 [Varanus komodoensis]
MLIGQHDGPLPRQHAGLLPESLIWAYVVQLSSALRTIHTAGLACRVMDPTKILVTGKTRLRVNCVGVFDVLTFDNSQNNPLALMAQYQSCSDFIKLIYLFRQLICCPHRISLGAAYNHKISHINTKLQKMPSLLAALKVKRFYFAHGFRSLFICRSYNSYPNISAHSILLHAKSQEQTGPRPQGAYSFKIDAGEDNKSCGEWISLNKMMFAQDWFCYIVNKEKKWNLPLLEQQR